MSKSTRAILGSLVAVATGLGSYGCTPDWATQDNSPVSLFIVSVNGAVPLASDVWDEATTTVRADVVTLALANRAKNQTVPVPNIPSALFVERYEVRYVRSDGRGVEGVDVPFAISGAVTFGFDVADSGTVELPLEVVRAQAKLESPLRNLRNTPNSLSADPDPFGGGAQVLTVFADITLHARTPAGQVTTATGRFQIDFADYQ